MSLRDAVLNRVNLLDFDLKGLTDWFQEIGEKPFRAKQVLRWLHHFGAEDFEQMTDLAKSLRAKLQAMAEIRPPVLLKEQASEDGTRKFLLEVGPGNHVETVFIPDGDRGTLCVSTQVGCALECRFCSTGRQGFNRNLTTAEILGQLWWANKQLGRRPRREEQCLPEEGATLEGDAGAPDAAAGIPYAVRSPFGGPSDDASGRHPKGERIISNVVLMGMGEPLLNYENTVTALSVMLDDHAYGLSRRRVTVSTSGIVPAMDRLRIDMPVALAVSLHAPNDALRDELVPINRKYPLKELMAACRRYLEQAPRDFITFEYVMLDGVNDQMEHAEQLIQLVRDLPCKFNLIPFNPFPHSGYRRSHKDQVRAFASRLLAEGIVTTTRRTRGDDIDAACGQLAGQVLDKTRRTAKRMELAS